MCLDDLSHNGRCSRPESVRQGDAQLLSQEMKDGSEGAIYGAQNRESAGRRDVAIGSRKEDVGESP